MSEYQPPPLTPIEVVPPKKRGVSAAEKYAELETRGEERPVCECHGEMKGWNKDSRKILGGYWICGKKYLHWRALNPEKVRESWCRSSAKKRSNPNHRRLQTIYMIHYYHNKKMEGYVRSGLINEGFTHRDNGEEGSQSTSRAA